MNISSYSIEIKINSINEGSDTQELKRLLVSQRSADYEVELVRNEDPEQDAQSVEEFFNILKIIFDDASTVLKDAKIVVNCIQFIFDTKKKLGEYFTGRETVEVKVNNVVKVFKKLDEDDKADFLELLKKELYHADDQA